MEKWAPSEAPLTHPVAYYLPKPRRRRSLPVLLPHQSSGTFTFGLSRANRNTPPAGTTLSVTTPTPAPSRRALTPTPLFPTVPTALQSALVVSDEIDRTGEAFMPGGGKQGQGGAPLGAAAFAGETPGFGDPGKMAHDGHGAFGDGGYVIPLQDDAP